MPQQLGLNPDDPTVRTAVFGVQVQEWLQGPIGSYVMGRVRTTLSRLELSLKKADPGKPYEIAKIQAEIQHWEAFAGWLGDAVQAGMTAEQIIDGELDAQDS